MYEDKQRLNPNPITKLIVVGFLGFTVINAMHSIFEWIIISVISIMFYINSYKKEAVKTFLIFCILFFLTSFNMSNFPLIIKLTISMIVFFRIFYILFSAGKFLIKTSDVGSIISSMDILKVPQNISIPITVMFRFFPSFVEERNNIKMAMKIRGIKTKNPIKYIEYVFVPLLIISSNIAEDISKAAETKCIANPIKKTRYVTISLKPIDFIYSLTIISLVVGGYLCSQ